MTKSQADDEIYGLNKAIATAWSTLAAQPTAEVITRALCAAGNSPDAILVQFLGQKYTVIPREKTILASDGNEHFNLFHVGIILHYLVHAKNQPLANKLIGFRELWGGNEYYYAFNNRVLVPLTDYFGERPKLFMESGKSLGGEPSGKGEFGLTVPALPRVPVTVLLWTGDEEVPPAANVLFDASANEQMETEALVWLAVAMVSELKKADKVKKDRAKK